jgi:hypothetical protein
MFESRLLSNTEVQLVSKAFITGCKTCQQVRSKCKCQPPVESGILLYDRSNGKLTDAYLMFFMPKEYGQIHGQTYQSSTARVKDGDIEPLLPESFDEHGGHNGGTQERFEMPEAFNPKLITFLESRLAEFHKPPVGLYLSFPDTDVENLKTFFESKGLVFPEDAQPIKTGSRGGTTERYATSVRVSFPEPPYVDMPMFKQFKVTTSSGVVFTNHLRVGLKLLVEYPHLVNLSYSGKQ